MPVVAGSSAQAVNVLDIFDHMGSGLFALAVRDPSLKPLPSVLPGQTLFRHEALDPVLDGCRDRDDFVEPRGLAGFDEQRGVDDDDALRPRLTRQPVHLCDDARMDDRFEAVTGLPG